MLEALRAALRRKPFAGAVISLAIHAVLLVLVFYVHPKASPTQKKGDALIVELPTLESGGGTPGPSADAPTPAPPAPKAPPTPPAPPAPKAPPRPPVAAKPTPAAPPRETPRPVASAPQPAERGEIPAPRPAPQTAEAPRPAPEPPREAVSAPQTPPGPVAMAPPAAAPDIRRRPGGSGGGGIGTGGLGGSGGGRGGIMGEPVPLDSKDPDFRDYLERVRALIKKNWGYPCVKNQDTRECEYRSARLVVDFGILRDGPVQFVEIRQPSGLPIYDDYAVNAIKLASPFPAIPAALMARIERGSTGLPIRVNFTYQLETGVTNVR
jgi:TonB family protein